MWIKCILNIGHIHWPPFNVITFTPGIVSQLKKAKVMPVYKSGESDIFSNYKQVSIHL